MARPFAVFVVVICTWAGSASSVAAPAAVDSTSAKRALATVENQPYPIEDGLVATVVGTPSEYKADLETGRDFAVRTLEPLVERDTPPTLRYARPLKYLRVMQSKPAPLAFVIAGTGASALSSKCLMLSRALHDAGYSVACLPSPTSVPFILGAAKAPVPGRMPADVRDLYRLMQVVRDDMPEQAEVTGYGLTGWSLGATQAAFIAAHDAQAKVFGFSRVMLLNPAVDVWASVQRMDALLTRNLEGGIDGVPAFVARGLGGLKQLYGSGEPLRFNEDFLYRAYVSQSLDDSDIAAVVGLAFRLSLANMAFAADVITDADAIVPRDIELGPYDSMDRYIERAFRMSFGEYIDRLLLPYWNADGRSLSRRTLVAEARLPRIREFLADNPSIAVQTAVDDPILDAEEVAFLRDTFGARARITPRGGHMGNLSSRASIQALQEFFSQ